MVVQLAILISADPIKIYSAGQVMCIEFYIITGLFTVLFFLILYR
jgi:hypothetical protein